MGIAFANGDDSFELLMKRADTALYEAKQAGKGTFRFHHFVSRVMPKRVVHLFEAIQVNAFDPAATGVAADRALRP
ncbi:hypothetical protein LJR241_001700 [Paraburkholderia hospita]